VSQSATVPNTKQMCLQQPFKLSDTVTMPWLYVKCCSCPWSCFRPEVWHDGGGRCKTTNEPSRYVPGVLLCHITRYQRCAVCLLCEGEVMYSAVFVIPSVCLTAGFLWKLWMNVCKVLLRCTVGGKEFDGDLDWNPRISKKILFFAELSLSSHC